METAAHAGAKFLEALFFIGLIGSTLVVLVSFVEDLSELFHTDEEDIHHTPAS